MQITSLFISQSHLAIWSGEGSVLPEPSLPDLTQPHSGGMAGALEALPLLLEQLPAPENTKILVVLDQGFSFFRHLQLPPLKPSKVKKVLPFELENQLIYGLEEIVFDSKIKKFQAGVPTDVGVFYAQIEEIGHIKSLIKKAKFELQGVTCLSGLLDQSLTSGALESGLFLFMDQNQALILYYQDGFLTQLSQIAGKKTKAQLVKEVNVRLKTSLFSLGESTAITLSPTLLPYLEISEKKEICFIDSKATNDLPDLFPAAIENTLQAAPAVNLVERETKGLKEMAKGLVVFQKVAILAAVWLAVYLSGVGYQLYQQGGELKALQTKHRNTVNRYAPGVPPSRALKTIKTRLKDLSPVGRPKSQFWPHPYPASDLLLKLSNELKAVEGIKLAAFAYSAKGLNIQGQAPSLAALEQVKTVSGSLFPAKKYRVRFSQKPGPEGAVIFSFTVAKEG